MSTPTTDPVELDRFDAILQSIEAAHPRIQLVPCKVIRVEGVYGPGDDKPRGVTVAIGDIR